jgi:8-oxo-dGTP diphosphatase
MKLSTLVYIIKNNKVLMLHRNKKQNDQHSGLWVAPGGKLLINESPYECAVRETKEETGLNIKNLKLCGTITFPDLGDSPFNDLWYCWVFKTSEFEGDLINSDEGTLKWIEINKLNKLNMWTGDYIFTPLIFKNKIFCIKIIYKKNKFINHEINYV